MVTWSQDILPGYLVDELGARLAYRWKLELYFHSAIFWALVEVG
jgi:hypothetical protein